MKQCPQCQRIFDDSWFACEGDNQELIEAKDAPDRQVAVSQKTIRYAGLWRRFAANAIDAFIVITATILLFVISGTRHLGAGSLAKTVNWGAQLATYMAIFIIFYLLYDAYFIYRWGKTLGKRITGIKATNADMSPISFKKSFLRIILYRIFYNLGFISGIGTILYITSAVMAHADKEKKTWHDKICKTVVIRL